MDLLVYGIVGLLIVILAYLTGKQDGYTEGFIAASDDKNDLMDKFSEFLHREIK